MNWRDRAREEEKRKSRFLDPLEKGEKGPVREIEKKAARDASKKKGGTVPSSTGGDKDSQSPTTKKT